MKGRRIAGAALVVSLLAGGAGRASGGYEPDEHTWALYHFEGNYQDSSPNGRHLTVVDRGSHFGFADSRPGWDLGRALHVKDISSDGSAIYSTALRYPGTGDWAIEAMVLVPGDSYAQLIVHYSEGVAAHDPYQMGVTTTGLLDWRIDQQDGTRVALEGPVGVGSWHHVAAVYDESESMTRIYVDFVEVDSAPASSIENRQRDNVYVGSISFGARGPLYLDELRISTIARVPEPATLGLLALAGLGLGARRRPRRLRGVRRPSTMN